MHRFFKKKKPSTTPPPLTKRDQELQKALEKERENSYKGYLEMFARYEDMGDKLVQDITSPEEYNLYFDKEARRKEPLSFEEFGANFNFSPIPTWRVS